MSTATFVALDENSILLVVVCLSHSVRHPWNYSPCQWQEMAMSSSVSGHRVPTAGIQQQFETGVGARVWEEAAKKPASRVLNCRDDTQLHRVGGATEA